MLTDSGIAADRIEMRKPQTVTAGSDGADKQARRVDIVAAHCCQQIQCAGDVVRVVVIGLGYRFTNERARAEVHYRVKSMCFEGAFQ